MALQPASIVITGMGMMTPIGSSGPAILTRIRAGQSAIRPVSYDPRFTLLSALVDEQPHIKDRSLDYARTAFAQAWAQAAFDSSPPDPWRVATVIGSSKGRVGNLIPHDSVSALHPLDFTNFSGDTVGLAIARENGFAGPVLNYPAACATGIASLVGAIRALQHDIADVAIAGSTEAGCRVMLLAAFKNMGALSSEIMRPFDLRRSGFNPGEGGAVFVLEREADARARGAQIIAHIRGWDLCSDATHITGADPTGECVSGAIGRSVNRAGWSAADIDYINAHGTGTKLNDLVEGRAINRALPAHHPLVSSIKPYIGHALGASAAIELAIILLCARDQFIPPTLGLDQPDPHIPLQFVTDHGRNVCSRHILKLSLGFGGHIGVVALEVPLATH